MLTTIFRLIKKHIFLAILFSSILSGLTLNSGHTEVKNLGDDFDYSNLSEKEKKNEGKLLFKYARKAYLENDFEMSKFLFYEILELDPKHPAANKYLNYLIPQKIERIQYIENRRQQALLDKSKKLELKKQIRLQKEANRLNEQIEKVEASQEAIHIRQLAKLTKDEKLKNQLKAKKIKEEKTQSKKQEVLRDRKEVRLKKEKEIKERMEAGIEAREEKKEDSKNRRAKELERQDEVRLAKENRIKENLEARQNNRGEIEAKREERLKEKKESKEFKLKKKISQKIAEKELATIQKKQKLLDREETNRKKQEVVSKKQKANQIRLKAKREEIQEDILRKQELISKQEKTKTRQSKIAQAGNKKNEEREKKESAILEIYRQETRVAYLKNKIVQIKALYKEAMYCYKIGKYDLAEASFNKIIEIDSTQVRARDYINIYIPQAQKKSTPK